MSWIKAFVILILLSVSTYTEAKDKGESDLTLESCYITGRAALEDELYDMAEKKFIEYPFQQVLPILL